MSTLNAHLNAQKFRTMQELRDANGGYISSGYPALQMLSELCIDILVGQREISKQEVKAVLYSTLGRAGITGILRFLAAGKHVVSANDIFGGTWAWLSQMLPFYGGKVTFVDINNAQELGSALTSETAVVFAETFSNPMMKVSNIPVITEVVKNYNENIIVIIDDTVSAGLTTNDGLPFTPLMYDGVDITVASLTKYACGFGDERGGVAIGKNAIITKTLFGQDKRMDVLSLVARLEGLMMHPQATNIYLKRIKNIRKRQEKHSANAMAFAEILHDAGIKVNYPGLSDHNLQGYGGMLSIDLGTEDRAVQAGDELVKAKIGVAANSFGEEDTLIEALYYCSPQWKGLFALMGIPPGILRISFGWRMELEQVKYLAKKAVQILK